jgi:hydrogenase maturation protein HypF
MTSARSVRVRGVVQGVGFRPFVLRLAREHAVTGWVLNEEDGVALHLEGPADRLRAFLDDLQRRAPAAAAIAGIEVADSAPTGARDFAIRESRRRGAPTTGISPDLCVCHACLAELHNADDPRFEYPYINCTECGPRYSIIERLPYDREHTTMRAWTMDERCAREYHDPASRRFHAQPLACPGCGPAYRLHGTDASGRHAVRHAAQLLQGGAIVAIKGVGGYHLACDATNMAVVESLRERKFRKEKPFAVMVRDVSVAHRLAQLGADDEALLTSSARPIVLAAAREPNPAIAPDNGDLGVMLPYTPLHVLLFAAGAPDVLVMTSANRSSEPIAYEDDDALQRLDGIADAFLVGERPIARRVEDSVVQSGSLGPVMLRRSRGYAPGAVATLPAQRPILALGADLKNSITLVVDGQAFVSQHIGDLEHHAAYRAFDETVRDLLQMYDVAPDAALIVCDTHPQYRSSAFAASLGGEVRQVQHHRAHIASVLAERGPDALELRVLGVSLDGTGFGDDGSIWGGEVFVGSARAGFERVAHLRRAALVGGDAAAKHPLQAAAGFVPQIDDMPDLSKTPFHFGSRYAAARRVLGSGTRVFETTSAGRLFDVAAALTGFVREITFEGQAAIWLEHLARTVVTDDAYPFPFDAGEWDFRPLLGAVARDRARGRPAAEVARAFHEGVAGGLSAGLQRLADSHRVTTIVASGGVFQNQMLLGTLAARLERADLSLWTNRQVPPNDGGISLGQAALVLG